MNQQTIFQIIILLSYVAFIVNLKQFSLIPDEDVKEMVITSSAVFAILLFISLDTLWTIAAALISVLISIGSFYYWHIH